VQGLPEATVIKGASVISDGKAVDSTNIGAIVGARHTPRP